MVEFDLECAACASWAFDACEFWAQDGIFININRLIAVLREKNFSG